MIRAARSGSEATTSSRICPSGLDAGISASLLEGTGTATVTSPLPRPLPASCSPQRSDRRGRRTRASFPTDMLSLGEPWTGSAPRPESAWRLRPPKAPVIPPWALPDRWRLEHCSGVKANVQPGDVPRLVTGQEGHEMADVLGIDVGDGHGLHDRQLVHDVLS